MPAKLPTFGNRIKFSDLRTQYSKNLGAGDRLNLSDFYRKGDYVVQSALNNSIPTSGRLKMTDFNGKGNPQNIAPVAYNLIGPVGQWQEITGIPSASSRDSSTQLLFSLGTYRLSNNISGGDLEVRNKTTKQVLTPTYSLVFSDHWEVFASISDFYFCGIIKTYNIGATTDGLEFRHTNSQNTTQQGCAVLGYINNAQIASSSTLIDSQTFKKEGYLPEETGGSFDITLDMEEGSWGAGIWNAWGQQHNSDSQYSWQTEFVSGGATNSVPVNSVNTAFNRGSISRKTLVVNSNLGLISTFMSSFVQNFGYDLRSSEVSRSKSPMKPTSNPQYSCAMLVGASFRG